MSQWSEKIPKENLSETVSSTRYFFGSFKIQINNFRKSFKKFIVDLLTRNVALNLSGAIFFVGLSYSLKWWYKDQLFVILIKQNLPALSESQQNVSWETGEAILKGEYQTWTSYTPLIDRIDLYANHVRVKFKQPWEKHVYERFLGVFGESAQINVCKQVLTTKDWWKENNSASNNYSLGEKKKNTKANPELYVPFQGKSSFIASQRTNILFEGDVRSKGNLENVTQRFGVNEAEISFANRTPFYLSPLNMENELNSEEIGSKERNNFSFANIFDVNFASPGQQAKEVINVVNRFSTYTPEKSIFPKRCFKLSPRNLCFLNLDDTFTLHSFRTKFSFANGVRKTIIINSSAKQRRGIHKKPETAIKLSYPLQLTKKLTGWQPSYNLLVLNSYRDEIPYKLENTFQSYFPKKDSQLLFLSTSFRKAIILPTTREELRPINGVNTSHNDNRPFPLVSLTSYLARPSLRNTCIASEGKGVSEVLPCCPSEAKDEMLTLLRQGEPFIPSDAQQKAELRTVSYQNQSEEIRVINCKDYKEVKNSQFLDLSTKLMDWETQLCQYILNGEISKKENNEAKQLGSKDKETTHKINFSKFLLPTKQTETSLKQSHLLETKKLLQNQLALLCKAFPINFVAGGSVNNSFANILSLQSYGDVNFASPEKLRKPSKVKGLGVPQSIDLVDNKSNVFATSEIGNESNLFETNDHQLVNVTKKILTVKTNQQKGPKGALLFANTTIVNDAHAVKREGLDPLLLLNTLGFTFNNFSPLTNPPILLTNTKLVTSFASLKLVNLFKSGVNINSITPHQKSFANIFSLLPFGSKGLTSSELRTLEADANEGKLRLPPVQKKGLGVTQSNLKNYKPLFNFLSQSLWEPFSVQQKAERAKLPTANIEDVTPSCFASEGITSHPLLPKDSKEELRKDKMLAKGKECEQEKYVSFYFNPKTLNWVIFQQSTNCKFNSLLKKIVGKTNQLVTTQSTHLIFEILKEKKGLSSLPSFASPVGLTKQRKNKRAFTSTDCFVSFLSDAKQGKEAGLFTGPITSNEPITIGFPSETKDAETSVLQSLSSARQKLALLRGLRNWEVDSDKFTTISNINKINLKLKETKFETLNNINLVDKGINFDQNSRYMSGYVYPDIQSNFLKAHLDQWFVKNSNFFKFTSFVPTRFQRNEMIGTLDKACLSDIQILSKKIKPAPFTTPATYEGKLVLPKDSKSCLAHPCEAIPSETKDEMLFLRTQSKKEDVHSSYSEGASNIEDVSPLLPKDSKDNILSSSFLRSSSFRRDVIPSDAKQERGIARLLKERTETLLMPSKAKEAEINFLRLKSLAHIGNIEVPYKKFNHYLAKFPGFSDPNQFFTTLPQISGGNENLVNTSQGFANMEDVIPSGTKSAKQEEGVVRNSPLLNGILRKQSGKLVTNYVDLSAKSIDKSEINKLFIQKNGCNFRKVAYSGIVVQRNKWTKDFQPFKDSKKLLDGASKSSIWGTLFLGPENPLTNRQCHFFGQKQLSTLDTNSLQRDYLRQLGKEILTQSNSKGYTELSKFSSIERTKVLSLSKKVNSFFFKKRKYSYLLEPKDQWHLLFQEQLSTALEDGKKYPSRSFEETSTALHPKEEKLSNFKDSLARFGSGRIKISAPLVMARFPKKLVQSGLGKPPQPRKSIPSSNGRSQSLASLAPFELARNDNYLLQQVSPKPQADYFASLGMSQLPSYRLEQGISWRPFCHLQRSYLLNDALLTSLMLTKGRPFSNIENVSKVSTSNPEGVKINLSISSINPRFNNQNKLSELGEDFTNSIMFTETSGLAQLGYEKTNGVFANPLEVVISMSPYFSYLPSASFDRFLQNELNASCFASFANILSEGDVNFASRPKEGQQGITFRPKEEFRKDELNKICCPSEAQAFLQKQVVGVKAPTLSVYPERLLLHKGLLRTRTASHKEQKGNESSQSLKLISHYPLFTERFTEEINAVPYLNKNSLFYLPISFHCSAKDAKQSKAPSKFKGLQSRGIHKSIDSVGFANILSFAKQGSSSLLCKGQDVNFASAKPSTNSLLGIQNICTSLLIQEPSCSASGGKPWAVLNQWIFLIALLFWIEQTLLENVFPALFALEQILLSAAGIKTGGNNRPDGLRISKNETPKFHNLAGIDGLLGELSELVLFLRGQRNLGVAKLSLARLWNNTDFFAPLGMPLNKKNSYGVLLTGSPGTGKTFLVRALANEAKVPVLILSASTLTASKLNNNKPSWSIRQAFKRAKQLAPCILFIDEIDALGKSRGKIVTDINEIVADTNLTSASSLGHKRMFVSRPKESLASSMGRAQLMFSYEQFGQNCSNFTTTLLNKWEYPLQSTILQESNEINQNSLCQEKLVDLLKIGSPGKASLGKLANIRNTKLNDDSLGSRKGSELIDSSRSKKDDSSDDLSYPKEHPSEAQQQLQKEMTRGKFGPLTQLLVSMDGVSSFSGVLIMGATNRPELLDPALTRPGRFEKIIRIDKPSEQNRIEILQLYSQNLGVQQQIPWSYLATRTIGLTTADLAVAMNYSSLRAIIQGSVHTLETIEYGLNCITRL